MSKVLVLIGGAPHHGTSAVAAALYRSGVHMEVDQPGFELDRPGHRPEGLPDSEIHDLKYPTYEIVSISMGFNRSWIEGTCGHTFNPPHPDVIRIKLEQAVFIASFYGLIPNFPFALKDPRFTFLFSSWKSVLKGQDKSLKIVPVMVVRPPIEGASALVKRKY